MERTLARLEAPLAALAILSLALLAGAGASEDVAAGAHIKLDRP